MYFPWRLRPPSQYEILKAWARSWRWLGFSQVEMEHVLCRGNSIWKHKETQENMTISRSSKSSFWLEYIQTEKEQKMRLSLWSINCTNGLYQLLLHKLCFINKKHWGREWVLGRQAVVSIFHSRNIMEIAEKYFENLNTLKVNIIIHVYSNIFSQI